MVFAVSLFIEGIFDSEKTQMTPTICPMKSISYSSERGDRSMTVQNFIGPKDPKDIDVPIFFRKPKTPPAQSFLVPSTSFPLSLLPLHSASRPPENR